jgi:hydrogenase maturation protease
MNAKTLVIGYGNTLRSDDGAGIFAAERIAKLRRDVDVITQAELTPELAEKMSSYGRVVFIDASVNAIDVEWRAVRAGNERNEIRSHAVSPHHLSRLCAELYGALPLVELVEIPANNFELGEKISEQTERTIEHWLPMFEERMKSHNLFAD